MALFGPIKMRHHLATKIYGAQDLEDDFGEIVSYVGGTYYVGGVAQTNVPGALVGQNFKRRAGLSNDYKLEPRAIFCHQLNSRNPALPGGLVATVHRRISLGTNSPNGNAPGFLLGAELLELGFAYGDDNQPPADPTPATIDATITVKAYYGHNTFYLCSGAAGLAVTGLAKGAGFTGALTTAPKPFKQKIQNVIVDIVVNTFHDTSAVTPNINTLVFDIYGKAPHVA